MGIHGECVIELHRDHVAVRNICMHGLYLLGMSSSSSEPAVRKRRMQTCALQTLKTSLLWDDQLSGVKDFMNPRVVCKCMLSSFSSPATTAAARSGWLVRHQVCEAFCREFDRHMPCGVRSRVKSWGFVKNLPRSSGMIKKSRNVQQGPFLLLNRVGRQLAIVIHPPCEMNLNNELDWLYQQMELLTCAKSCCDSGSPAPFSLSQTQKCSHLLETWQVSLQQKSYLRTLQRMKKAKSKVLSPCAANASPCYPAFFLAFGGDLLGGLRLLT